MKKHVKTIARPLRGEKLNVGCKECQTSCQSACKTSATIANQICENEGRLSAIRRPFEK